MDYKVKFKVDILYPKSRISSKSGDIIVSTDAEMEAVKKDKELPGYIKQKLQSQIKTGNVFSVVVTDIEQLNQ